MNEAGEKISVFCRQRARKRALQALYQWSMTKEPIQDVIREFMARTTSKERMDEKYFRLLTTECAQHYDDLLERLSAFSNIPPHALDPIERVILIMSMYELHYMPDLPWRVVIDEAVEQAKTFGAEQSFRFINGVLDKAAKSLYDSKHD